MVSGEYKNWAAPIDPENGLPMEWYAGTAELTKGTRGEGLQMMKRARDKAPHHIGVLANLAAAYNYNQDFPAAIAAYHELLKIFPDFEEARLNLAISLYQSGDAASARGELRKIKLLVKDGRYRQMAFLLGMDRE